MPLLGSASCSAFDVSTRKVPSLALVPRGYLNHAVRAKKKVAGSIKHSKQQNQISERLRDEPDGASPSPPHPARRESIGDTFKELDDQLEPPQESKAGNEEEGGEVDDHEVAQSELSLGERFLNMMALMARLSTQSLGDNPLPTLASPNRLTGRSLPFNTDKPLSSTPQRPLSAATTLPPQQQSPIKSPPTSPIHAVRKVAKRLPRALQGPLTFDICMLLPTPLDERQSPLRSPVRRKRLRKRVRRRLRRRSRRSWQASHASWPPHASADYIVDHARQDIAGINAACLVQRLGVNTQALPRASPMPLPPLKWNSSSILQPNATDEEDYPEAHRSEDDEQESDGDNLESDVDDEDEDDALSCNNDDLDSNETPFSTGNTVATTTPSISEEQERVADTTSTRRRPLYHQPAWISPELHTWLVTSGLFATKPRHELLSTDL